MHRIRSQRGQISGTDVLIILVIMVLFAAAIVPNLDKALHDQNFEKYIGLKPNDQWEKDPQAKAIVQGLVTQRLTEHKTRADGACQDAAKFAAEIKEDPNYSEPPTPEAAKQKLAELEKKRAEHRTLISAAAEECGRLKKIYEDASGAAKSRGFKLE